MKVQITFPRTGPLQALDARIRSLGQRLERLSARIIQEYERPCRWELKAHRGLPRGRPSGLDSARGFGRIETDDGRLIYCRRNSVLGRPFHELTTGVPVSVAEEAGALGPQASTVRVL